MKLTQEQLDTYKNRRGSIYLNEMSFQVEIKDARMRYGHLDLLVAPTNGDGQKWIEHHKVVLS